MEDRKWKLGVDMIGSDNLLDSISIDDVVLAVHCNAKSIDRKAVMHEFIQICQQRLDDAAFILKNNIDEIIEQAKKGRGEYDKSC